MFSFFQKHRMAMIFIWALIFAILEFIVKSMIILWIFAGLFGAFIMWYEWKKGKEFGKIVEGIRWYKSHRQIKK